MIAAAAATLLPAPPLALLVPPAQAAPFSYDPVSFNGYANAWMRGRGRPVVFRALTSCQREGKAGYRCLEGEVLITERSRGGRSFCRLGSVNYQPLTGAVVYLTRSCAFRDDRTRVIDQAEKLLRKGLEELENRSPQGQ
ncbi:MAG: hypothetical protein VKI83_03220 [Synechococcaceae cyanobacterium]|nr:hypothetical protein [Synechococcaceae cyanobacterium]